MNTYGISFCGIDNYISAETSSKAKYKLFLERGISEIGFSFGDFLKAAECRKVADNSVKSVYSFYDDDKKLCVDCSECVRGGNGDRSCSAGWLVSSGGYGGCFSGELLRQYEQALGAA